jgi:hypothetical protein
MKKIAHTLSLLTSLLALGAGACSSSPSSTGGTGGSTGAGGAGNPFAGKGIPLIPTSTGFVDDRSNSGVYGPWYGYADSAGPNAGPNSTDFTNSSCNKGGFTTTDCSTVMPIPGQPFPPAADGSMCGMGVGAVVKPGTNGQNDYSHLWGAGIAVDLNNAGVGDAGAPAADAGAPPKGNFDLSKYKGIGFTFTGTMIPPNKMRVNFPFTGEHQSPTGGDSPYWMGTGTDHSPLPNNSTIVVKLEDIGGPYYLTQQSPPTTPPPFDATKTESIQFQVFTNASTTTPFQFCVNNLTLLTELP